MTDVTKTIISRIQQRRGLKQDLPQPLRPGELGFATDTNQLYIGADPSEYYNDYSKISRVEQVAGAALALNTITANKLITFTVPFYEFTVTVPNTTTHTWLSNSASIFGTKSNLNQYSNAKFTAATVSVFKSGNRQSGDTTEPFSGAVAIAKDFKFDGNLASANNSIKFRTPLLVGDTVSVCYYSNAAILDALTEPGQITLSTISTKRGFYDGKNVPASLYLDPRLVTVSETSGRGFIALEDKHLMPYTVAQPTANTGLSLSNLIVESSTILGVNATVSLSSVTNLNELITTVNAANVFIKMEKDLANMVYITMRESYYTVANPSFILREDGNTLSTLAFTSNTEFTPMNTSVKRRLENWIGECINQANLNLFNSVTVAQKFASVAVVDEDPNLYQVDPLAEPLQLVHTTREETQAFNQVVNGAYVLQDIATNKTGIVNIKTNIEIPTELSAGSSASGASFASPYGALIPTGTGLLSGFSLPSDTYDTYIIEYSASHADYQRVGTMMMSARPDLGTVAFTDTATEINNLTGSLSFAAGLDVNYNITLTATNTLPDLTFRYIFRRWNSI